jgi:putative spermidine/putrescine transport system substrate-binding protein
MKKLSIFAIVFVVLLMTACGGQQVAEPVESSSAESEQVAGESMMSDLEGTEVFFYGWGGDPRINAYIDDYLATQMKEKYGVTLTRVGMNIDVILSKLLSEKSLDAEGTIDVMWINGENFYTAKSNDLLYGPFVADLPNAQKYLDFNDPDNNFDFGYEIEGYEAPYGKAQLVFTSYLEAPPTSLESLKAYVMENPGQFTYAAPPDFEGSAFVRNVIYETVGFEEFLEMEADYDTVKAAIMPAMDYLKSLKPYMWQEGNAYPSNREQLDTLFANGEVFLTMTYNPNHVSDKIKSGVFKENAQNFLLFNKTIGNTHFLAIPMNAPNAEGAKALINEILSVESQAYKFNPDVWGDIPVLDNAKLSAEERELFNAAGTGIGTLSQEELLEHRYPEMPAHLVPIIEKIWLEEIPN